MPMDEDQPQEEPPSPSREAERTSRRTREGGAQRLWYKPLSSAHRRGRGRESVKREQIPCILKSWALLPVLLAHIRHAYAGRQLWSSERNFSIEANGEGNGKAVIPPPTGLPSGRPRSPPPSLQPCPTGTERLSMTGPCQGRIRGANMGVVFVGVIIVTTVFLGVFTIICAYCRHYVYDAAWNQEPLTHGVDLLGQPQGREGEKQLSEEEKEKLPKAPQLSVVMPGNWQVTHLAVPSDGDAALENPSDDIRRPPSVRTTREALSQSNGVYWVTSPRWTDSPRMWAGAGAAWGGAHWGDMVEPRFGIERLWTPRAEGGQNRFPFPGLPFRQEWR